MNTRQLHLLWVTAAGLTLSGLLVYEISGNLVYQLLVANGVLSSMAYLAFRGFLRENPRFLVAREKLTLCLWIMVFGDLGISLSTVLTLASRDSPASWSSFWVGGISFLLSAWGFIISLLVSKPKPISP